MWHPDIPEEYRNQIVTGDARELSKRIPDESIDLIFTDPPYPKEYLYVWEMLGSISSRVLRDNGFLLTYSPCAYFEYVFDELRKHLDFYWPCAIHEPGMNSRYFPKHVLGGWRPVLMFRKNNSEVIAPYFPDGLATTFRDKYWHKWGQNDAPARIWIRYLCPQDGIVFDPFVGGGTTAASCKVLSRNYIAFEIDPDTAEKARERVLNTQPPLFVPEPEQMEIDL